MKKVILSKNVYETDFNIKAVGYDCKQVDQFLDELNIEIEKLERQIEELKEKVTSLEGQNNVLNSKNRDLNTQLYTAKSQNAVSSFSSANLSNMDVYNRISDLESKVQKILDIVTNKS